MCSPYQMYEVIHIPQSSRNRGRGRRRRTTMALPKSESGLFASRTIFYVSHALWSTWKFVTKVPQTLYLYLKFLHCRRRVAAYVERLCFGDGGNPGATVSLIHSCCIRWGLESNCTKFYFCITRCTVWAVIMNFCPWKSEARNLRRGREAKLRCFCRIYSPWLVMILALQYNACTHARAARGRHPSAPVVTWSRCRFKTQKCSKVYCTWHSD